MAKGKTVLASGLVGESVRTSGLENRPFCRSRFQGGTKFWSLGGRIIH